MARQVPAKLEDEWTEEVIDHLTGGLNVALTANLLDPSQTPMVENMFFREGRVLLSSGYKKFGAVVRGTPRREIAFERLDESVELCLVTTVTFYKWSTAAKQWQYVKGPAGTNANGGEPAGETVVEVDSVAGFSIGNFIGVILDNGTQHQTTVAAVGATTITMDDAVPVGRSILDNAVVVIAVSLAGTLAKAIDYTTVPNLDWLVFTDGLTPPQRYNGTDCIEVPNLPGTTFLAETCIWWSSALLFGNITLDGTKRPVGIYWCDTADPTNWTTGTAGNDNLYNTADQIRKFMLMGSELIIYRHEGTTKGTYVGTATRLFLFLDTQATKGLLATLAVVDGGDQHFFMGHDDLYIYEGGLSIVPFGLPIRDKIFGDGGELNPSEAHKSFALYCENYKELWFVYARGVDENPRAIIRYKLESKTFSYRILSHEMSGFGVFRLESSLIWSEIIGAWEEQTTTWDARSFIGGSATILFSGVSPAQVYEYDFVTSSDDGIAVHGKIRTKNFVFNKKQHRIDNLKVEIRGTEAHIMYSIDRGVTWQEYGMISSISDFTAVAIYKQVIAEQIAFEFECVGTGLGVGWIKFEHREESVV